MKIQKGDKVKVRTGKDRGKTGAVIKVSARDDTVIVEGINLFKKRVRPKKTRQKGEVVLVARPLSIAKVSLVCTGCKNATRVGFRMEGNTKTRYCKKCKSTN